MIKNYLNISKMRREYYKPGLSPNNLTIKPMQLFKIWLQQACIKKIQDANSMCIATVDNNGQPYQRLVLLKYFNDDHMIFFTNLKSRKAQQLKNNPKISCHFSWQSLDRQVMILGYVKKISILKVKKYFYTRPKNSQISSLVSRQSSIITSKKKLIKKFKKMKKIFLNKKIPFPKFWGGYQININTVEFWQGGKYRLHDRFIYQKEKNHWSIKRLAP